MSLFDNFQTTIDVIKQALSRKADVDKVETLSSSVNSIINTKADKSDLPPLVLNATVDYGYGSKPYVTLSNNKTIEDIQNAYNVGKSIYVYITSDATTLGLTYRMFRLLTIQDTGADYKGYQFFDFTNNYGGTNEIIQFMFGPGSYGSVNGTYVYNKAYTNVYSELVGTPTFATVATSGLYSDLSGTPTLATVATSGSYNDLSNKPTLATVATTGSYNDLSNKPTIPVVPTNISSFTNDVGYVTAEVAIGSSTPTGNEVVWYETNSSDSVINSKIKIGNNWETFDSNIEPIFTYDGSLYSTNYTNCLALINSGKKPMLLYNGALYRYSGASTLSPEGIVFTKMSDGSGNNSITIIKVLKNSPYISTNTINLQSALPIGSSSNYILKWIYSNNKWDWGAGNLDTELGGKENTSNKVTSISSSSTDTQYPSAKLLYDTKTALETAFTITLTFTSQSGGTLDKTDAEIESAINTNKKIVMNILGDIYTGFDITCNDSDIYFYFTDDAKTLYAVDVKCVHISRVSGSTTNAFTYYTDFLYGIASSGTTDGEYIKWDYANNYWTRSGIVPENVSNKVTSLSSSSTDTQYPSAKCVYDIIGDVETSLSTINTALAGLIGGNS